jgi:hypothetical protein
MSIYEIAENMAAAIREWNRAKQERESWKPVPGQVPPIGILGSAKKANAMLTRALEEYEQFKSSEQLGGAGELVRAAEEILKLRAKLTRICAPYEDVMAALAHLSTAVHQVQQGSVSTPENNAHSV